jgi:uncharacterized DUF497 family protein
LYHAIALTNKLEVFSWGSNKNLKNLKNLNVKIKKFKKIIKMDNLVMEIILNKQYQIKFLRVKFV